MPYASDFEEAGKRGQAAELARLLLLLEIAEQPVHIALAVNVALAMAAVALSATGGAWTATDADITPGEITLRLRRKST